MEGPPDRAVKCALERSSRDYRLSIKLLASLSAEEDLEDGQQLPHLAPSAPQVVHSFCSMLRAEARSLTVVTIVGTYLTIRDFAPTAQQNRQGISFGKRESSSREACGRGGTCAGQEREALSRIFENFGDLRSCDTPGRNRRQQVEPQAPDYGSRALHGLCWVLTSCSVHQHDQPSCEESSTEVS